MHGIGRYDLKAKKLTLTVSSVAVINKRHGPTTGPANATDARDD